MGLGMGLGWGWGVGGGEGHTSGATHCCGGDICVRHLVRRGFPDPVHKRRVGTAR